FTIAPTSASTRVYVSLVAPDMATSSRYHWTDSVIGPGPSAEPPSVSRVSPTPVSPEIDGFPTTRGVLTTFSDRNLATSVGTPSSQRAVAFKEPSEAVRAKYEAACGTNDSSIRRRAS